MSSLKRDIQAVRDYLDSTALIPNEPRVLARITEEGTRDLAFSIRCETCALRDSYYNLSTAAHTAESHSVQTGHAVLVEAL